VIAGKTNRPDVWEIPGAQKDNKNSVNYFQKAAGKGDVNLQYAQRFISECLLVMPIMDWQCVSHNK